jgi:endonuclease/exonuclease/phosphatase family metal-dependent hydrolase
MCFGQSQNIKVMTYNIRFDNPGDGVNRWSGRKDKVISLLKGYDPDILGVQEALVHQIDDITANTGYAYVGVGRDDGKKKGEYSAILFNTRRSFSRGIDLKSLSRIHSGCQKILKSQEAKAGMRQSHGWSHGL